MFIALGVEPLCSSSFSLHVMQCASALCSSLLLNRIRSGVGSCGLLHKCACVSIFLRIALHPICSRRRRHRRRTFSACNFSVIKTKEMQCSSARRALFDGIYTSFAGIRLVSHVVIRSNDKSEHFAFNYIIRRKHSRIFFNGQHDGIPNVLQNISSQFQCGRKTAIIQHNRKHTNLPAVWAAAVK